jgi:hypothetical protein
MRHKFGDVSSDSEAEDRAGELKLTYGPSLVSRNSALWPHLRHGIYELEH